MRQIVEFICDGLDKPFAENKNEVRHYVDGILVSEDEMNEAQAINSSLGIDDTDIEAQLFTANELRINRINE